ncbi:Alpha/Beta hydrolase protein [Leucosporidium creatinivorum]|uniref:Alpha/Beta hydrolase protein n=1 Tax=Leucosporidium creatinivorum TaxID=106004 RepID=A0A1Y2DM97_9BASI|nr:Alpha/Beta hydrolase protein [Leucosporidium creatinivorum]
MAASSLLTINGRPLFVESTGSDTSLPLLVALHGLGGSTNLFPIASWLAAKYTVVRFDFEGAGKSPYQGGKWEISDLVEDVKAVVEALGRGGEAIHLFGHSLGSAVSLHFAATYPELTASVTLSCPGVARAGNPEGVAASLGLAKLAREKGPFQMADFTAMKNTRPSSTLLQRALVRTAMQESSPEGYAQACEMISRTGSADWSKIVAPVLVIAGREDQISSLKAAEEVASCLVKTKSVKVVEVEAGHQPAVECPEVVLSLLEEFLGV